jgi:CubicO group peptidase (beta-lactamase class C family)
VSDALVRVPKKIAVIGFAVIGFGAIGLCASACGEPDPRIERLDGSYVSVRAIETEIPEIMAGARLPGLQIAVINGGQVVYKKGFGVRSTETLEPVTDRTVFAALSFSKTIFAYLVIQLADEGLLDLDRPLVSYLPKALPEYEFYRDLEGDELHTTLTARMALSHTTGLPNWRWFTPEGTLQFVFEPGERFSYSGEGIRLLQLAVEVVVGESVEELARARIFEPLGMERTSFVFLPAFEDDYAVDHDHFLAPIGKGKRDEANAAGSAQTTAADYATFLAAVMRGEGLSAASREELSTPQVSIEHVRMFGPLSRERSASGAVLPASWGLGWGLVESEHGRALFHTGNDEGAANYHVAFPDRGIAVVLLGNSQTLESAAPALTELLVGDLYSPYGFLGYEPYDSPRHRLVEAIASSGFPSGLEQYVSLTDTDKGIGLWHVDEWGFLDSVGRELIGLERFEEAADFYRHFLPEHPDRTSGYNHMATALVHLRDYEAAREAYRAGLEHSPPGSQRERDFRWRLEWIGALLDPPTLPAALLREYAGDYGERHVEMRDGVLYYFRERAAIQNPRRLHAISEETFVLEDEDSFKLRFERGSDGSVNRVTGLYLDGQQDESERDPTP